MDASAVNMHTPPALQGIRVLDLSRVLAGPWASQILGDFGAEVLKVERPGEGDDTRRWGPPFIEADSDAYAAYYSCCNRNKEGLAVDFARPEGADLIKRLARRSDIFIENFRVGQLRKYGLDYETLSQENPRLIYCSVTGFGQFGPYAGRGGYDVLIQGMSGLMTMTGHPNDGSEDEPLKVGIPVSDLFAGLYAAVSILTALHHRERTGEGQYIDCSLLDSQLVALSNQAASYLVAGVKPKPLGNEHPTVVPYRDYATSDGRILVAIMNDRHFRKFCRLLGQPSLADDPRFCSNGDRLANRRELEDILVPLIRQHNSVDLLAALESEQLPAAPINTIDRILADPHVRSRKLQHTLVRDDGVEVPVLGYPHQMSRTPATVRKAPPRLGQDTRRALKSVLGLSDERLDELEHAGTIADSALRKQQPA